MCYPIKTVIRISRKRTMKLRIMKKWLDFHLKIELKIELSYFDSKFLITKSAMWVKDVQKITSCK